VLRKGQDQLAAQRQKEEELRQQVAGINPNEASKRAAHMREQRDRILAMKKAEREKKVQAEAEQKAKMHGAGEGAALPVEVVELLAAAKNNSGSGTDAKSSVSGSAGGDEAVAEERRATLRNALARRMKLDLLEKEEEKLSQAQDEQFSALDRRLQQVEQTREDNRQREFIMTKQIKRQKAQIAKNILISAQSLARSDGFDA
jgi:hypothetical protein